MDLKLIFLILIILETLAIGVLLWLLFKAHRYTGRFIKKAQLLKERCIDFDDIDVAEAHARIPEEIHHDSPPEVALLQHAIEPQHLLGAEFQIPDQDGVPVHIIPHLGRCRPRVDGQYLSFLVFHFPFRFPQR